MKRHRNLLIVFFATCVLPQTGDGWAAITDWTGLNSNNWNADTPWTNNAPDPADVARFNASFLSNANRKQPEIPTLNNDHDRITEIRVQDPGKDVTLTIKNSARLWLDMNTGNKNAAIRMIGAQKDLTITGGGEFRQRNNDGEDVNWIVTGDGDLTISTGTFIIQDDVNLTINVSGGRFVDIQSGTDHSGGGASAKTAEIIKTGNGLLILGGNNGYEGDTTVSEGELQVSGSIAGSATTVASGATVGGGGTFGNLTVLGSHTPGLSPGIDTVDGDYLLDGGTP